MSSSILITTKAALGIPESHTAFDSELVMHINAVLSTLTQLGVGSDDGFMITNAQDLWTDFFGVDPKLNSVKSYVFLRVKMLFDPPDVGFVITAMKDQIKELEWRINVEVDTKNEEGVNDAYNDSTA